VFPLIVYVFFGTSRQIGIGPVAVVSLMIASAMDSDMSSEAKAERASYMAFTVGVIMIAMGLLRMGIVVNFISHSVMSAFTSAAGITIGTSQLKNIFGVTVPRYKVCSVPQTIIEIFKKADEWHWWTVFLGFTFFTMLFAMKKWKARFPKSNNGNSIMWYIMCYLADFSALICAVLGIVWCYLFNKSGIDVKHVGSIPEGLRAPSFDNVPSFDELEEIFIDSFIIAIVGFLESIAVSQIMALKFRYRINANQELIGIGTSNFVSALFSGFPIVGSFSRTAVNGNTGARTQMSGAIAGLVVLMALYALTSLFYYLPLAALSAMILVAVMNLIDFDEMILAYHLDKRDFVVMLVTFLTTILLGVKEGLFAGIALSILLVVQHSAFPRIAILGKTSKGQYRDVKRFDDAVQDPNILILRLDAKLFFANSAKFCDFIQKSVDRVTPKVNEEGEYEEARAVHTVLIDARGINDIDLSGIHALAELVETLHRQDLTLVFCNIKDLVKKRLLRSSLSKVLPEDLLSDKDTQEVVDFIHSPQFWPHSVGFAPEEAAGPGDARVNPTPDSDLKDPPKARPAGPLGEKPNPVDMELVGPDGTSEPENGTSEPVQQTFV